MTLLSSDSLILCSDSRKVDREGKFLYGSVTVSNGSDTHTFSYYDSSLKFSTLLFKEVCLAFALSKKGNLYVVDVKGVK